MTDTTPILISLDTQYQVAQAIYTRFHANAHRHPRPWTDLDAGEREPWRLIAKDAISTTMASPEMAGMP